MDESDKNVNSLVSVIVPVYNVKQYLQHCLETISAQSYQNLEMILVDDGSTDGSGEICDSFAETDKRCVVVHQKNQGLWAARNTGQKIARGNYIMFIDSDDYIHVDMIKCLYESLKLNPQCGFAMCNYKPTESFDEDIYAQGDVGFQVLSTEHVFCLGDEGLVYVVWNKLYRKTLITGVYARDYRIAQDVDYNSRVYSRLEYAVFVDREFYFWMQRPNSATHKSEYWYSFLMVITDIYYRNYNEILSRNELVSDHLLQSLYWRLLSLRSLTWQTNNEKIVSLKCRKIMKETWKSYLLCRRVSFLKRFYVLALLNIPTVVPHGLMLLRRRIKKVLRDLRN